MRSMKAFLRHLMAVAAICAPITAFASEPVIGVGDTLEISVLGMPEMLKRTVVDEDGGISYPLLGVVKAESLSRDQLRQSLVAQLVKQAFLKNPRITVEIVARPPFYVTGDIMKPGAQPYAPNIKVEAAVALAGGLDLPGFQGRKTEGGPRDTRAQFETIAYDYVRQRTHLLSLEAELAGRAAPEAEKFSALPIAEGAVSKLNELEHQDFVTQRDAMEKEKASLVKIIAKVKEQLKALSQRRKSQEEGIRDRESELASLKGFADRGIVVQGRVVEEQRSLSILKSGLYESIASEAQTSRLLEEYERKLASVDETRRLKVIKDIQDAYIATAVLEANLANARRFSSAKRSNAVSYVIVRRKNGAPVKLDADEQTDVMPGDMIEVRMGLGTAVAAH